MNRADRRRTGYRGPAPLTGLVLDSNFRGEDASEWTPVWAKLRALAERNGHRYLVTAGHPGARLETILTAGTENGAVEAVFDLQSSIHAKFHGRAPVRWIVFGEPALRERITAMLNPMGKAA